MKSNKLCRMKKKFFLPMLVSLQLLFGSCENNFDPYIYGFVFGRMDLQPFDRKTDHRNQQCL